MRIGSVVALVLSLTSPVLAAQSQKGMAQECPDKGGLFKGIALKEFQLDYIEAAHWNGCVVPWTVDPGTVAVVKLHNANKKRYRIKIGSEVHPASTEGAPAAFREFLGLAPVETGKGPESTRVDVKRLEEAKTALANKEGNLRTQLDASTLQLDNARSALRSLVRDESKMQTQVAEAREEEQGLAKQVAELQRGLNGVREQLTETQRALDSAKSRLADVERWETLLVAFGKQEMALNGTIKALDKAYGLPAEAGTFCELRDGLAEVLPKALGSAAPACPAPAKGCSDALELVPACAAALAGVPEALAKTTAELDKTVTGFRETQASGSATVLHSTLLGVLEARAAAARKAVDKVPEVTRSLAAYYSDPAGSEARLFETAKSVTVGSDPVDITISVESGDTKDPLTEASARLTITPATGGGFAFSNGVVFTGLVGRSYAVRDGQIVRKGSEDWLKPGVGILAHWRFSASGHLAATVGFAGKDSDLQYLAGLSWLTGSKQRFVVTGGVAVGGVERLDGVEEGEAWKETSVPTRKSTQASWLFGLSFKF